MELTCENLTFTTVTIKVLQNDRFITGYFIAIEEGATA